MGFKKIVKKLSNIEFPMIMFPSTFRKQMEKYARIAVEEDRSWRNYISDSGLDREKSLLYGYYDRFYESIGMGKDISKKKFGSGGEKLRKGAMEYYEAKAWFSRWTGTTGYREQSAEESQLVRDAAYKKAFEDPIAASIINNMKRYIIGRGVKFTAAHPRVQKVLEDNWALNEMESRQKKIVWGWLTEGEYFLLHVISLLTGDTVFRKIRTYEVENVYFSDSDREIYVGYEVNIDSGASTLTTFYPDVDLYYNMSNGRIKRSDVDLSMFAGNKFNRLQFFKYGCGDEERGRVPMESILRLLKYYEDWIRDRVIVNHEKNRIVWKKIIKRRTSSNVNIQTNAPPTGSTQVLDENTDLDVINAKIGADDAKADGLAILYNIGSAVSMPIHILNQRATEQTYASIRKSDSPFSQMIMDFQDDFATFLRKMQRAVIRNKMEFGVNRLPKTVKVKVVNPSTIGEAIDLIVNYKETKESSDYKAMVEKMCDMISEAETSVVPTDEVNILYTFPQPITEDPLNQAKTMEIHSDLGLVSIDTMRDKAGYGKEEQIKIELEKKAGIAPKPKDQRKKRDIDKSYDDDRVDNNRIGTKPRE